MAHEIPILKSALKVFLKSLPVRTKFNICSFGSTHSFLSPKSRSYDSDSLKEAVAHVEDFAANYGGTEIQNAMKAAIDSRFADLDCEILLLTDGDIWRQQELFNYLNDTVGNEIRVFSLGIGGSVSSSLIEGVARAGKGFAQMVGEGEKFENKVVRMMKGALFPHVSDYTMEVKYEKSMDEEDDATWEMVEKVTDGLKVMLTKQLHHRKQGKNIRRRSRSSTQASRQKRKSTRYCWAMKLRIRMQIYQVFQPQSCYKRRTSYLHCSLSHGLQPTSFYLLVLLKELQSP